MGVASARCRPSTPFAARSLTPLLRRSLRAGALAVARLLWTGGRAHASTSAELEDLPEPAFAAAASERTRGVRIMLSSDFSVMEAPFVVRAAAYMRLCVRSGPLCVAVGQSRNEWGARGGGGSVRGARPLAAGDNVADQISGAVRSGSARCLALLSNGFDQSQPLLRSSSTIDSDNQQHYLILKPECKQSCIVLYLNSSKTGSYETRLDPLSSRLVAFSAVLKEVITGRVVNIYRTAK